MSPATWNFKQSNILKLEKFENQNFEARTVCLFKKPTQFPKDISIKLIKQIFLRKFFKVAQSDYNTNATDAGPTNQHPVTTKNLNHGIMET